MWDIYSRRQKHSLSEKWNVVPSLTFMSASKVGHNICKISTGMIHLISNQVLYEPVFCALSWGVFISTWSVPYPTLSISTIQFHPNPTQSILKCSNFPKLLIIWPLICENYPPLKLIKKTEVLLDGGVSLALMSLGANVLVFMTHIW